MTRRNEDSGLIDLDALMREAAAREATGAGAAGAAVPAPPPTPAPSAVRTEAHVEALVPALTPTPSPAAATPSTPEPRPADGRATVRPPALIEREKRRSASPPSYTGGEAVQIVSIAKAGDASKVANDVTPAPPLVAKAVPPAPATKPSKLEPDSLEAVTTDPRSTDHPRTASASASIPPVTERSAAGAKPSRRAAQIAIGAALAVALLAGTTVFMRSRSTVAATNQVTTAAPTGAPSVLDEQPTAAAAPAGTDAPSSGLSADDLPAAATSASAARSPTLARMGGVLPKPGAKSVETSGPAVLTEADLAGGGPSAAGDLGDAMRGAVGAKDQGGSAASDATSGPNAKQVRPSPGAVVGALGSVLPTARACLSPDDPVRSGLVVFKSDGTVARVDIKGTKPEDDCVRSALSKAKVAPFVEESFSTRVTVRP